jgi:hypothetical protein
MGGKDEEAAGAEATGGLDEGASDEGPDEASGTPMTRTAGGGANGWAVPTLQAVFVMPKRSSDRPPALETAPALAPTGGGPLALIEPTAAPPDIGVPSEGVLPGTTVALSRNGSDDAPEMAAGNATTCEGGPSVRIRSVA